MIAKTPSFYCGGKPNWIEQFAITQPSTRHAQLRALGVCIFRQVGHRVARRIADAQYMAPNSSRMPAGRAPGRIRRTLDLDDQSMAEPSFQMSNGKRFALLGTEIERDLFRILRNFAQYACSQKREDFPFPLQHVADRLGVSFQYVSKLRQRFD